MWGQAIVVIGLLSAAVPAVGQDISADLSKPDPAYLNIKVIDDELGAITRNMKALAADPGARQDEIASLRSRFPEIKLSGGATAQQIYAALSDVRNSRAQAALPGLVERQRRAIAAYCEKRGEMLASWASMQQTDAYKGLSLDDRLAARHALDDFLKENDGATNCSVAPPKNRPRRQGQRVRAD